MDQVPVGPVRCTTCGEYRPHEEFAVNIRRRTGRQSYCRVCAMAIRRIKRGVDPAVARMLPPRGQCCEICDDSEATIVLDHDHETGMFRGWLCNRCNTVLGMANDDPHLLQTAIAYIEGRSSQ